MEERNERERAAELSKSEVLCSEWTEQNAPPPQPQDWRDSYIWFRQGTPLFHSILKRQKVAPVFVSWLIIIYCCWNDTQDALYSSANIRIISVLDRRLITRTNAGFSSEPYTVTRNQHSGLFTIPTDAKKHGVNFSRKINFKKS